MKDLIFVQGRRLMSATLCFGMRVSLGVWELSPFSTVTCFLALHRRGWARGMQ